MFSVFRMFEAVGAHDASGIQSTVSAGVNAVSVVKKFSAERRRNTPRREFGKNRFAVCMTWKVDISLLCELPRQKETWITNPQQ